MLESSRYTSADSKFPPVFIVGLPRSGTTYLYQLMADRFELGYINNFYNYFYGLPLLLTRLPRANPRNSHRGYESSYGHVAGCLSPSEHFGLWRRLYGENVSRGAVADNTILSRIEMERLRNMINSIQNRTGHSYLFKCLYLNLCVTSLAHIFDSSRFIHIERKFESVFASMLQARKVNAPGRGNWWSVRVPGWKEQLGKPLAVQVTYQLTQLGLALNEQLSHIPPARYFHINYDQLCANPGDTLRDIGIWFGA